MSDTSALGNTTTISAVASGDKITAATFTAMLDVLASMVDHTHTYTDTWTDNCNCNCTCACSRGQI
jgi:hypothetical protein